MVKIRLSRIGRKKRPFYRIIVVDSHKRRDADYIERIGYYHPLDNPATVLIDGDAALKWLRLGAQPTDTVHSLLQREGVWFRFLLEKRGLPEDKINELMTDWMVKHTTKPVVVAPVSKPVKDTKAPAEEVTPVVEVVAPVVEEPVAEPVAEPVVETPTEAVIPVADPA